VVQNIWTHEEAEKVHNDDLRNMCSLPNIIMVIESRRLRWTGYAEGTEGIKKYTSLLEILKGEDHLENLGVVGRTILKCI
jgi:hypothetical protein